MYTRILVVDDEEIIRQLLTRKLEERGYLVETAEDGEAALERVKRDSFNLLITDLKMPRVDGMDVLKEIKKINPYVEVIIITGYPTIESAVEAIKIGAFDFICKPFDLKPTLTSIEQSLEKQKFNLKFVQLTELMSLFEISKTITLGTDLDTVFAKVIDVALELTEAENASLLLLDENSGELEVKAARGATEDINGNKSIKVGKLVFNTLAKEKKPGIGNIEGSAESSREYDTPQINPVDYKSPFLIIPLESQGNIFGVICVTDKISGKSFTERELSLLTVLGGQLAVAINNAKLYNELQDKIGNLRETVDKLHQTQNQLIQTEKLAALGRFSSGIAHEVKNPLAIVLGGIEFLELKLPNANEENKTAMIKIKESTLRANDILMNLLKFAKPSGLKIEEVNLKDLVSDTLELLKYRAPISNINIETQVIDETLIADVDKTQIEQVIFNLLINAVEAMPKGGNIKVKIYKSVVAEFSPEKEMCVIEIIDTGEGIAKENQSRLFEPFFTTKRERTGTGLGLSIVKIIIENHKGKVVIDSEQGKGTDARIILPLADKGGGYEETDNDSR